MQKLIREIKGIYRYAVSVFKITTSNSISTSQNILTYVFLGFALLVIIAKQFKPSIIASYLPRWEFMMNLDWWELSLMALGGIFLIRLILAPYLVHRKLTKEYESMQEKLHISDTFVEANTFELMELRRKVREAQGDIKTISDIPVLLQNMLKRVDELFDGKKQKKQDKEILLKVFLEFSNVERDDSYLKPSHFNNPIAVGKSVKFFTKRMGLDPKKRNPVLEKTYRRRITHLMEENKIGFDFEHDAEYCRLNNELKRKRMPIAGTLVDMQIDNFIEDMIDCYSFKLIYAYAKTEKQLHSFPSYMRDVLREFGNIVEKIMRINYGKVKYTLEKFNTGDDMGVKR